MLNQDKCATLSMVQWMMVRNEPNGEMVLLANRIQTTWKLVLEMIEALVNSVALDGIRWPA
jgi:hypothetical protein